MSEIKTVRIHCLSEALSPITHMMGTAGNEAIINRERVYSGGQLYDVPVLSGNAIRHKMVREAGALFLLEACGLVGKLNIAQANFLFYGGTLSESSTSDNLKTIGDMQRLLPLIRLLGGSLTNQVLGGSLIVSRGILVCQENRERLQQMMPPELFGGITWLRSCEDFISNFQYTRGDARKKPVVLAESDGNEADSNLMIFSGRSIIPGAVFYHDFILQNVSHHEVGALYAALMDWQKLGGGIIGGSARIGHGKLNTIIYTDSDIDLEACEAQYREHVRQNADAAAAWLKETLPAAKPRGRAKKGADEAIEEA
jgi:hypothetical protein